MEGGVVEFRDAMSHSLEALAAALTHCFQEYIVPANFTAPVPEYLVRVDAVSLRDTILAMEGDRIIGVLMVCRRGRRSRIGGMAVAKQQRSTGVGAELMKRALAAARERGDLSVVLEAIEQNVRALAFYEREGFRSTGRLIGCKLELVPDGSEDPIVDASLEEVALAVFRRGPLAASWEMSGGTVAQMSSPIQGVTVDGLFAAIQPAPNDRLVVRSMARSGEEDEEKLRKLTRGLAGRFPGSTLVIPPYYPQSEFGGVFTGAGLAIDEFSQIGFERELGA